MGFEHAGAWSHTRAWYIAVGWAVVWFAAAADAGAQTSVFEAGRPLPPERDAGVRVSAGLVTEFKGLVQETRRSFYDASGESWKQADAETFGGDDFDMESGYPVFGLGWEKNWRFTALHVEMNVMNPSVSTEAKRNYYLAVGEGIEYGGQTYDYLMIPEGTPFEAEFLGASFDLRFLVTPVTMNVGPAFRVTPTLGLGLFGFGGAYDIDAGPVRGVTVYQNPPEYFTIGGESSGYVGLALPELGAGAEVRIGRDDGPVLSIAGHYAVCQYDGSTKYVVSSSHREKNLDLDHVNIRVRCELQWPLASGRALTVGVIYQKIDTEGSITSSATDEEDILARRERFDKYVEFGMQSVMGTIGLAF